MKILYLCADRGISLDNFNGATAHFRSLVHAFRSLGHTLLVLTPSAANEASLGAPVARIATPTQLEDLLHEVDQPVPRDRRDMQRRKRRVVHAVSHLWNNVAVEQALIRHVERFKPDFVFELYSPYGVAGVLTCNRLGVRHVLNVHAPLAWEGATFRDQALQEAAQLLEECAVQHAQRIIANSQQMRDLLISLGVDREVIEVVINGVDLDCFSPQGETRRVGGKDSVVLGFSGSLKAWHGIDLLCQAFRKVAADPRAHLLVVGDGPMRKEVERLGDELPGRVTFAGAVPLEQVPCWVRGMDVAVAPYPRLEPFYFSPLKILDAMACGIANVASDIGQVPELLRHEQTGLLVPPGDANALVSALRRLVDDPRLRRSLAGAGQREAAEQHDWKLRASEIVDIAMNVAAREAVV